MPKKLDLTDNLEKYIIDHSEKLFGFFVGQVMKQSGGKANPQLTNDILKKLLKG